MKSNSILLFSKLSSFDERTSHYIYYHLGSHLPRRLLILIEHLGGPIVFPITFLFGCLSTFNLSIEFHAFCWNLFLGLFTDLALVGSLKYYFRRPRPHYNDFNDYCLAVDVDRYSFPSGHASRSTFIALLSLIWRLKSVWICSLVIGAIVISFSRVLLGRHYLFDVLIGTFIGFLNLCIISKARPFYAFLP